MARKKSNINTCCDANTLGAQDVNGFSTVKEPTRATIDLKNITKSIIISHYQTPPVSQQVTQDNESGQNVIKVARM